MMTPKKTHDWFQALKPASKRDPLDGLDGPYSYRSDRRIVLAEAAPNADLPADKYGNVIADVRAAAISGTVRGLRTAVRSMKGFAAADSDRVTLSVNGAMIVSAECYMGDARTTLDGPDYAHNGPDVEIGVSYKYLMTALDGLPDTVCYRVRVCENGRMMLGLSGDVRGAQREAVIVSLAPKKQ